MRSIYILLVGTLFGVGVFSQSRKTFKDASGASFEIMEFPTMYTIDTCVLIANNTAGWQMPDTAQMRCISQQWFGRTHTHNVNSVTVKNDIDGFSFLTSSKVGENYIEVETRDPIRKLLASSGASGGGDAFYSLLLIRPVK